MELNIYYTSEHLWRDRDSLTFNPYEYDCEDRLVVHHRVKSGSKGTNLVDNDGGK